MKRNITAIVLSSLSLLAGVAQAASPAANESAAGKALRAECANKYSANYAQADQAQASATAEYTFVYHKGQYKGEHVAGQSLDCTEQQYASYLNTVDLDRVMNAYPTAAGRPSIKAPRLPRTPSAGK
ncbi:hypothetical protein LNV08_05250 [Paucibacter sp. TC2R-5]|uniref:hypothetical protein n=1 Tax=Paucibacter sp. TC2R-5 TaxID=2893555 RepID=UPI0021E4016D|nr:hypothetical protein [Paucibacter sp. TC2R-5]MCV2358376.1 hypothetical protein [Paucibacter sp. TC2R-5]